MGRLTDDFHRLCSDMTAGREARQRLLCRVQKETASRKREVQEMKRNFRRTRFEAAKNSSANGRAFVANIKSKVKDFLSECAEDRAGARQAFFGATSLLAGRFASGAKRATAFHAPKANADQGREAEARSATRHETGKAESQQRRKAA